MDFILTHRPQYIVLSCQNLYQNHNLWKLNFYPQESQKRIVVFDAKGKLRHRARSRARSRNFLTESS